MRTLSLSYSTSTGKLSLVSDTSTVEGNVNDNNAITISVTGLPQSYLSAKIEYGVIIENNNTGTYYPFSELSGGSCTIPRRICRAATSGYLPVGLKITYSNEDVECSVNQLRIRLGTWKDAEDSMTDAFGDQIMTRGASWDWLSGWTYQEGAVVVHNDIFWKSLDDDNKGHEPAEPSDYWDRVGTKGDKGDPGPQGPAGEGVPQGGTTGQVLTKASSTDYDFQWEDPPSALVSSVNGQTGAVSLDADDVGAVAAVSTGSKVYATDGNGDATTITYGTAGQSVIVMTNGSGKLDNSVIPPLAIGELIEWPSGVSDTKANLVQLTTAEQGDIAKVTSDSTAANNGVYMLNGSSYAVLSNWVQIVGPGSVISVNGQTGIVTLTASDVGALADDTTYVATVNGLSGTVTGMVDTAGTGLSKSGTTLNHSATILADSTSAVTPDFGETFAAIDEVTRDSTGHVTKVNVKTMTLPEYVAGTGLSKSGDTFNHSATILADTTSTQSPDFEDTVTVVDEVTRDSTGHVTKINTKTVTLPQYTATDGIKIENDVIKHTNAVTAQTAGIGSATAIPIIKYDAQGHITEITTVTVYPPTSAGTAGQYWKSDGSGAGVWTDFPVTVTDVTITEVD